MRTARLTAVSADCAGSIRPIAALSNGRLDVRWRLGSERQGCLVVVSESRTGAVRRPLPASRRRRRRCCFRPKRTFVTVVSYFAVTGTIPLTFWVDAKKRIPGLGCRLCEFPARFGADAIPFLLHLTDVPLQRLKTGHCGSIPSGRRDNTSSPNGGPDGDQLICEAPVFQG